MTGPMSRKETVTIREVPNMGNREPNDPSLALCQLCKNRGEMVIPVYQDGDYQHFPACHRYVLGCCNDFVPDHTAASKQVAQLIANYGRR